MPIETFAGKGISSTYQRVVQTDGTYLADGTGSLINNLTLPGNLIVSGTLYAQNTVVVTQSFSSGSNILGDAADDFQTLYGTVRIPTGSLTVSGALQISSSQTSYIIGSGNVGIGTTTPDARLTVAGGSGDLTTFYSASIKVATVQSTGNISYNTNYSLGLVWGAASLKFSGQPEGVQVVPFAANYVGFSIRAFSGQTFDLQQWKNSSGVAMSVVNNNGSFGIGTASPSASLHISGASTANLLRIESPASSSILVVTGSGNVGIGTNTPAVRLHVVASAGADAIHTNGTIFFTDSTKQLYWQGGSYVGKSEHYFGASNYEWKSFDGANVVTRMNINASSGNVGVGLGAVAPTARLQVRGSGTTSATTAFRVDNANTSASLVVLDNGNVGIGTTAPSMPLQITSGSNTLLVDPANSRISSSTVNIQLFANGQNIFRGLDNWNATWTDSALTTYFQTGRQSGNTAFSTYLGSVYNRVAFLTSNFQITNQSSGINPPVNYFQIDINNNNLFSVASSASIGRVGINNISPSHSLDVSGSGRFTAGITVTGSFNVSGSQNYNGDVNINGTLTATVKSFLIEHPTQPGKKLQYGNLEGPEHAVYFRGRTTSSIIELPEEWTGLVDEESITVQLTSIGKFQPLYVSNITSTRVEIQVSEPTLLNYHYLIHGERKDIDKLITTIN